MGIEYQERAIDRYFAAFICRTAAAEVSDLFRLVVSLASSAVGKGSSCLDLADVEGKSILVGKREFVLPQLEGLVTLLRSSSFVGSPGGPPCPLVLDGFGHLAIVLQRRRAGVDDDVIKVLCDGEALGDINVVRWAIEEARVGREGGGLREPGRKPIASDFAPRLIARPRSAIEAVETRWGEVKGLAHKLFRGRFGKILREVFLDKFEHQADLCAQGFVI